MTVGSLFSGIGGFDLGFERAGFVVRWQVEIDPFCRAVLAKHWPEVRRYEDVTRCTVADSERTRLQRAARQGQSGQGRASIESTECDSLERVDVLLAGFPCQPVSVAGQRLAQDDPRWLWPHVARLVRELRPRYVCLENVPGLLTAGFGDVLGDLAEAGYDAEWTCLRAADVGAPHKRERVLAVAYPGRARGSDVSDTERQGWEGTGFTKPARGRESAAFSDDGTTHAWPSGPGQPQHAWEPPRILLRAESGVGVVPDGLPAGLVRYRRRALAALGNAIVPQVAEIVARYVLAVESKR